VGLGQICRLAKKGKRLLFCYGGVWEWVFVFGGE